jgi:hypothetical protein
MRTIEIQLFKFEELNPEAQQRTIKKLYNINVDHEWWEFTYDDAKRIGLQIDGFDIGRANNIDTEMLWAGSEVAESIIKEHGESCETYKLAKEYDAIFKHLDKKYEENEELHDFEQESFELDSDFKEDLQAAYLVMLRKESEYLMTDEAIKETIIANEYEFTVEGGDIY